MPNKDVKRLTQIDIETTGTRFCTHCQHYKNKDNGYWKILGNGMYRRWQCGECRQNITRRINDSQRRPSDTVQ